MQDIYVIGGANIDIFATLRNKVIPYDSNPSKVSMAYGGVGHNIAANLAQYCEKVYFISAFGNDIFSEGIKKAALDQGLDLTYAISKEDHPSSVYLAIIDQSGDMVMASSDMRIIEDLKPEDFMALHLPIKDDDYVIIDTNLSHDTLHWLYRHLPGYKVSDAISANKVSKLNDNLDKIDILKLNLLEAEALFDKQLDTPAKIITALRALKLKGAHEVLITTKKGAYLLKDDIYYYEHDAFDPQAKNTTGSGDAFLAAYVHAHKVGYDMEKSIRYALSAAVITAHSASSVADINEEKVLSMMNKCHFKGGKVYAFKN